MRPVLRNIQVEDPDDPATTLGDIDRIEDGVLWEEKSARFANDPERWARRHITEKFRSYLEIRRVMPGYEEAPIGFCFEEEPDRELRTAVEAAITELRKQHPDITILLTYGVTR